MPEKIEASDGTLPHAGMSRIGFQGSALSPELHAPNTPSDT